MDEQRFKRLKSQLYAAEPLIGGLLRLLAVEELARDASPQSVRELAEFIPFSDPSLARSTALAHLRRITTQPAIDVVCETWAETRHEELSRLMEELGWVASNPPRVRALTALKLKRPEIINEGDQAMAMTLIHACRDEDLEIAEQAQQCLLNLQNPRLIDAVCTRWVKSRDPLLARFIADAGLIAGQPAGVRAVTALKAGRLELLTAQGAEVVESLVQTCDDVDREIAERAQDALLVLRNPDAQDALCRYFISHDHPRARDAAIASEYAPRDVNQRALFFFLTAQWEKYESLDFDHRLLRLVYEAADEDLRRRIAERARRAGRLEWVEIAAGGNRGLRLGEMKDAEWEVALAVLGDRQRWAEMWRLAQDGPALWAGRLLRQLKEAGWRPQRESEAARYAELAALVEAAPDPLESLLEGQTTETKSLNNANRLAISSDGKILAIECKNGDLQLWRMPEGKLLKELKGAAGGFGFRTSRFSHLVFSRDGQLLAGCDYTNTINLWRTVDGQPSSAPIVCHHGFVTFDISADGRTLASVEYGYRETLNDEWQDDHGATLILRTLPDGAILKIFDNVTGIEDITEGVAFSPDGRTLAVCQTTGVRLLGLPDGKFIARLPMPDGNPGRLIFSEDGQWLAARNDNHQLRVWRARNGEALLIPKGCDQRIRCYAISSEKGVLVTLDLDGLARWHRLRDGVLLQTAPTAIRSYEPIALSSDGQMLVRIRKKDGVRY